VLHRLSNVSTEVTSCIGLSAGAVSESVPIDVNLW
jgi:hypothetical protein